MLRLTWPDYQPTKEEATEELSMNGNQVYSLRNHLLIKSARRASMHLQNIY